MATYDIETAARFCGIHPITLRTWQRHGLLKPQRESNGQYSYSDDDLSRVYTILEWLKRGTPLGQIKQKIKGEKINEANCWHIFQADILTILDQAKPEKLRQQLWRLGREYPLPHLVNDVLRPLRRFLNSSQLSGLRQQKGILDNAIIEYASFVLSVSRKRTNPSLLLMPIQVADPLELWLESLSLVGEGFRVEVIQTTVTEPDLTMFNMDHYLIWSDTSLSQHQQALYDGWLAQGLSVMIIGDVTKLKTQIKTVVEPPMRPLNRAFIEKLFSSNMLIQEGR